MKMLKSMLLVTVINYIALFVVTLRLPEIIPVHFNYRMEVDRYGSKLELMAFGLLPVIMSAGMIIYRHVTKNNSSIGRNRKTENIIMPISIAFLASATWLPVWLVLNYDAAGQGAFNTPVDFIVTFPTGVLLIIISNFMGVLKPNRFVGIRLPWTLKNETVWKKTHRLGGYTGVIGGVIMCVFSLAGLALETPALSFTGLFMGIFLCAFVPVVYSYLIYKKESYK